MAERQEIWVSEDGFFVFGEKPHTMDTDRYVLASTADRDRRERDRLLELVERAHSCICATAPSGDPDTERVRVALAAAIAEIEGGEG